MCYGIDFLKNILSGEPQTVHGDFYNFILRSMKRGVGVIIDVLLLLPFSRALAYQAGSFFHTRFNFVNHLFNKSLDVSF